MKWVGFGVVAAAAAMLWACAAHAETEAEHRSPASTAGALPGAAAGVAAPNPRPRIAASTMFAPAAAANAKRMAPEQREERRFLRNAAASIRFQADAARMALAKSNDPGVRSLAASLIQQQQGVGGNELLRMLHLRGMASPMLDDGQRRTLSRLARMQGARFDRAFMAQVGLKSQLEEVQSYEKAGASARDPVLKAWIARTLPTLRHQLSTAERIAPRDVKFARGGAGPGAVTSRPSRQSTVAPSGSDGTPTTVRTSEWNTR